MSVLCPFPKNLIEDKLKSSGLISLAKEITKQPNIDRVVWLLVITVMQCMLCYVIQRCKLDKEKYINVQFEEKRAPENVMLEPSHLLKEIESLKKGLTQN